MHDEGREQPELRVRRLDVQVLQRTRMPEPELPQPELRSEPMPQLRFHERNLMFRILRRSQDMVDKIVEADAPLTHIPKESPQAERSFGDDISIPNLVREHAPRHIKKLKDKKLQLELEIVKINTELQLLEKLQQAITITESK